MPDSDVSRMIACVPSCSGAIGSCTEIAIAAWLFGVSLIDLTLPTARPPTCTLSPFTSWPAFSKISVYSRPPPLSSRSQIARMATSPTAISTAPRAIVTRLLHAQRAAGGAGQELADEQGVRGEKPPRPARLAH